MQGNLFEEPPNLNGFGFNRMIPISPDWPPLSDLDRSIWDLNQEAAETLFQEKIERLEKTFGWAPTPEEILAIRRRLRIRKAA
jgi:hypothetical protein